MEHYANFEKLDPLHAGYKSTLAGLLHFAGDVDKAIIKARESIQLKPGHMLAINYLVLGYTDKNDTDALDSLLDSIPPAVAEMPDATPSPFATVQAAPQADPEGTPTDPFGRTVSLWTMRASLYLRYPSPPGNSASNTMVRGPKLWYANP